MYNKLLIIMSENARVLLQNIFAYNICEKEWEPFASGFFFTIFESYRFRMVFSTDQLVFNFWIHNLLLCEWNLLENKVQPNLYIIFNRKKNVKKESCCYTLLFGICSEREKSKSSSKRGLENRIKRKPVAVIDFFSRKNECEYSTSRAI